MGLCFRCVGGGLVGCRVGRGDVLVGVAVGLAAGGEYHARVVAGLVWGSVGFGVFMSVTGGCGGWGIG